MLRLPFWSKSATDLKAPPVLKPLTRACTQKFSLGAGTNCCIPYILRLKGTPEMHTDPGFTPELHMC